MAHQRAAPSNRYPSASPIPVRTPDQFVLKVCKVTGSTAASVLASPTIDTPDANIPAAFQL
jgi:hypothetical protein